MPEIKLTLTDLETGSLLALVRDAAENARRAVAKYDRLKRHTTANTWLARAAYWEGIETKIEAAALAA